MTQSAEKTPLIINIDELLEQSIQQWDKHVKATEVYVSENLQAFKDACIAQAEFRAYAKALTHLVRPFEFVKHASAEFADTWENSYRMNGGYDIHRDDLQVSSNRGTVDYWAASVIDPEFMALCRQNIQLRDEAQYGDGYKFLSAFDDTVPPVEVEYKNSDWIVGTGIAAGIIATANPITGASFPNVKTMGANTRLKRALKKRFEALMRDPAKKVAIQGLTNDFFKTYDKLWNAGYQSVNSPVSMIEYGQPQDGGLFNKMRRLVYLQLQGQTAITQHEGQNADGALTYATSQLDQKTQGSLLRILDKQLRDKGVQQPASLPGADSLWPEDLAQYTNRFDIDTDSIPEKPKAFVKDFVARAVQTYKK